MKSVLVLQAPARNARAQVDTALAIRRAVRELNELGGSFGEPEDDEPTESMRVLSWSDDSQGARIRFFADLENDVMYLQNESATAETLSTLTSVLGRHVPISPLSELKEAARQDATGRGLVRLAFGAPIDVDDDVVTQIQNGLQSTDALVRRNAGYAATITTWPELVPQLSDALATERDRELRELFSRYLDVLRRVKRR